MTRLDKPPWHIPLFHCNCKQLRFELVKVGTPTDAGRWSNFQHTRTTVDAQADKRVQKSLKMVGLQIQYVVVGMKGWVVQSQCMRPLHVAGS